MGRIERTVFLSYRRTSKTWALVLYQHLTHHGFDVFFDYTSILSGDFCQVICENIRCRAHFLALLTPSSLERCSEPGDLFRLEIEAALSCRRNIVPLTLDGFDFASPSVAHHLTGGLAPLQSYNALNVPVDYFEEAMVRLRTRYLSVPLDAVLHPPSPAAEERARREKSLAAAALPVDAQQLRVEQWLERADAATLPAQQVYCYSQALELDASNIVAYLGRASAHRRLGHLRDARADYMRAMTLAEKEAPPESARSTKRLAFEQMLRQWQAADPDGAGHLQVNDDRAIKDGRDLGRNPSEPPPIHE